MITKKIEAFNFVKDFNQIAPNSHRRDVFADFVFFMACAYHNSAKWNYCQDLEDEYLERIGKYERDDVDRFVELFANTITYLNDKEPFDFLGSMYMQFDMGNDRLGQFFTPDSISQLMALMMCDDIDGRNVSDPACGAGSTLLALARHRGRNNVKCYGVDLDRMSVTMCYVQMCIWGIDCEIYHGDSLKMEMYRCWKSPFGNLTKVGKAA